MTRIVVSKSGRVSDKELIQIADVMRECYERLEPHEVAIVDLQVFESASQTEAFLSAEYGRVGVVSRRFDEKFFALHHAWRGTPSITLCLERMRELPPTVRIAGIRHEVGHSILHGELKHYFLTIPYAYVKAVKRYALTNDYGVNLTYLTSIAVKDYEVTRLLYERGYVQDQVEYVEHLLATTEDDITEWRIARSNPLTRVLHLVASLKIPFCALPLLRDDRFGKRLEHRLIESLGYLSHERAKVLKTLTETPPRMVEDTTENIARAAELIADNIIEPHLAENL